MKKYLFEIKEVFFRELGLIAKDKNLISVLLLAPVFYAFFYGSVYLNKAETDVPVVVVDMDRSPHSQKLIRMLDAHQLLSIRSVVGDYAEGKADVENADAQGLLIIPKGFESDLKNVRSTGLKLYLNTTRFLPSNDINKAVNEVTGTISGGIKLKYFETQGYSFDQAKEMIEPIRTDMRSLFNYTESYGDFLIPAILILILHQTLLIGLSESFAKEREQNTLNELFDRAGHHEFSMLVGKGLFYFILYFAYSLFFFTVTFSVFKIQFTGNIFALSVSTILMLVAVISFSIFLSSFFERKIIAIQYLTLSSYPVFLISGFSWPFESMPLVIKIISSLIPFTPYSNSVIHVTQMGSTFSEIQFQIFQLSGLALFYYLLAHFRMNHLLKKSIIRNEVKK